MRLALIGALALALTLTACGKTPTGPSAEWEYQRPVPRPLAATPAPTAPRAPVAMPQGAALLAGLRQALMSCKGVEAEVRSWSEGHYKAGKKVSELRHNTYRSRLVWSKPSKLRGDILETDNFLVDGAKMLSLDGKTVKVKAGGVLGLFPLTLSADADLLASNRNHHFSDMSPNAMLTWMLGPSARWVVVGTTRIDGQPVTLVEVQNIRHLDAEITREVVGVEPATLKLRSVQMFAGAKKVVDYQFTRFVWNPKVDADTFEL